MANLPNLIASIPSPSSAEFSLGSLDIRYYGLMIALGVFAHIWVSSIRFQKIGYKPDLVVQMAWIAVPSGLIGARIYHLITDWDEYTDRLGDIVKIQEGGLGLPGAVIGAILGLWGYAKYKNLDIRDILDVIVPIAPIIQIVGRLGNWFNQELYGEPTDLPWAVEIDPSQRVTEYRAEDTFHPFFLYEILWSLCLMGIMLSLEKRKLIRRGQILAIYILGYTTARIGLEFIRVDFANQILGLRVNVWVMSGFWLLAAGYLARDIIRNKTAKS